MTLQRHNRQHFAAAQAREMLRFRRGGCAAHMLRLRWPRDHALSLAYFSKTSRVYSACIAFREICPFRSLAILKRLGSVGARDFLNLAILPNRLSNNPIVSSLARDMFRECFVFDQAHRLCGGSSDHDSRRFRRNVECRRFGIACIAGRRLNPDAVDGQTALERAKAFARDEQHD